MEVENNVVGPVIDCNYCQNINIPEYKSYDDRIIHFCEAYNERLYHDCFKFRVAPCEKCIKSNCRNYKDIGCRGKQDD